MGLDALAEQLVGNQVRHFMGDGLFKEVLAFTNCRRIAATPMKSSDGA